MKPYIVTLTYNFLSGRDFFATIIVEADTEAMAESEARTILMNKVGNCFVSHRIAFPFSVSIPSPVAYRQ